MLYEGLANVPDLVPIHTSIFSKTLHRSQGLIGCSSLWPWLPSHTHAHTQRGRERIEIGFLLNFTSKQPLYGIFICCRELQTRHSRNFIQVNLREGFWWGLSNKLFWRGILQYSSWSSIAVWTSTTLHLFEAKHYQSGKTSTPKISESNSYLSPCIMQRRPLKSEIPSPTRHPRQPA